ERRRGELLRLIGGAEHLHLDSSGRFDRDFLEIGAGALAERASLFDVSQHQRYGQRKQADHDDGGDDLMLETTKRTPRFHFGNIRASQTGAISSFSRRVRAMSRRGNAQARLRSRPSAPGQMARRGLATKIEE